MYVLHMENTNKVTVRFTEPKMPGAQIPPRKGWKDYNVGNKMKAKRNGDCPRCCAQILAGDMIYRQYGKWVCQTCKTLA